ncbi:MAG: hypothetical protein B7X86_04860 [Sphingobacteriales bacterium 17-39-43]|nr:MAG: hypothetical protein B7Y24_05680 [Sphingobacteriales bacterium 16-39-50]OZA25519.1 MAG: hypothetical protein B7X86_04860 [Sphingobacteriales bacterium 17-39-43]
MMNIFKQFLLSRYYLWLTIFLIIFCLTSVILLDPAHPLYITAFICAPLIYLLQRYRKYLIKNSK